MCWSVIRYWLPISLVGCGEVPPTLFQQGAHQVYWVKMECPNVFGKSERITQHSLPSGLLIWFLNFTFFLLLLIHFSHFCFVLFWNVGQSYEIRMLNRKLVDYTDISSKCVKVGGRHCRFAVFLSFLSPFSCFQVTKTPTSCFLQFHMNLYKNTIQQTALFESCHFRLITPDEIPLISALTWERAQAISSGVSQECVQSTHLRCLVAAAAASQKRKNGTGGVCSNAWRVASSGFGAQPTVCRPP